MDSNDDLDIRAMPATPHGLDVSNTEPRISAITDSCRTHRAAAVRSERPTFKRKVAEIVASNRMNKAPIATLVHVR